MRISLVVEIISLLLAVVLFFIFSAYEKYLYKKKDENCQKKYVGKFQEIVFMLFLLSSSSFCICLILNFNFIFNTILKLIGSLFYI